MDSRDVVARQVSEKSFEELKEAVRAFEIFNNWKKFLAKKEIENDE